MFLFRQNRLEVLILSRMEEDEQEIYEEVYSNRGNLQTYKTPVELNWYAYISTYYGYSVNNGTGQTQLHRGVTVNVRQGTEVKSAMNGFVVDVGYSGTFGNYVVTQDKKGVQIKYAYLQSISVANGQEVTTDTVIGTTGSTGSATGASYIWNWSKMGNIIILFFISVPEIAGCMVEAAVMMMRLCGDYLRKQTNILVCRMYGAVPARRLLLTVLVL